MKLPPYSKPLREALAQGHLPSNSVYFFIGEKAWEKGKISARMRPFRTLILPPNDDPSFYMWPVQGCDILIFETSHLDEAYIEKVALHLLSSGAIKVTLLSLNETVTIYKKDF